MAWWDHGAYITEFAKRRTVVDEDIYLPNWVFLTARALTETDPNKALAFFRAHGVTHLELSSKEMDTLSQISYIASDADGNRETRLVPMASDREMRSPGRPHEVRIEFRPVSGRPAPILDGRASIDATWVTIKEVERHAIVSSAFALLRSGTHERHQPFQALFGFRKRFLGSPAGLPGTLVLSPYRLDGIKGYSVEAVYIPPLASQNLMVRLFLLSDRIPGFLPEYDSGPGAPLADPTNEFNGDMRTKVWRIQYPPSLRVDPTLLRQDFPPGDLRAAWNRGQPYPDPFASPAR